MPTHRAALALVLALIIGTGASAEAQDAPGPGSDSADGVACALFGHLEADRWDAAAGLYAERFIETWHRALVQGLAEATDEQYERFFRRRIAVDSVGELRALSPREAAARALRAYDPAYQRDVEIDDPFNVEVTSRRKDLATGHVPGHVRTVVGTVVHGDRAWVGYRIVSSTGPEPDAAPASPLGHFWPLRILGLARGDGGWTVWPGGPLALLEKSYGFGIAPTPLPAAAARCPDPASATAAPADDAERIASEFLDLVDRERWAEAAGLFADDVLAGWHADQIRWRSRTLVRAIFAGVGSVEELEGLPPAEAAARNLERIREGVSRGREGGPRAELRSEVLGTISEGDLAHVLYRIRRTFREPGPEGRRVEIAPLRARTVTLRRTATGWTVLPRSSVLLDESPGG